jgi:DNA-binding response OmpR family regulator
VTTFETSARARWRVLLGAPDTASVSPVVEYLMQQGCDVTPSWPADVLSKQVGVLLPRLVVVAAPALLDVLDACRLVRSSTTAQLLVLGQHDVEADEVLSLEYGADTYLPLSCSARKMRAHLQAVLRRVAFEDTDGAEKALQFGSVRIDAARRRVYSGDAEVDLSQKEYALLLFLVEHAGRTVSRQDLADYVWGTGGTGESRSLDVHIHWLREKLEVDAANPRHIRTVRGIGYSFEP